MKRHTYALRSCLVLLVSAGAWGPALCQSDGEASRAGAEMNAAAVRGGALTEPSHPRDTQLTPVPPAPVPLGTALWERLDVARNRLQAAVAKREAAVQQGITGEEIKALDAGIE